MSSYNKIYIHIVFSVKQKYGLIKPEWEAELYKYITGAIQASGNKMIIINGVHDHLHFLFGMNPTYKLSDGIREIKKSSNKYIRQTLGVCPTFTWKKGYGAFSYGEWDLNNVINYIKNQKEHHKKSDFKKEYLELLNKFNIDYNESFPIDWEE